MGMKCFAILFRFKQGRQVDVDTATAGILRENAPLELNEHLTLTAWDKGLEDLAAEARLTRCWVHRVISCLMLCAPLQDDTGHVRVIGLSEKKEELYLLRMEVQGFEGLVVEGMQELLRRKAVRPALLIAGCANVAIGRCGSRL